MVISAVLFIGFVLATGAVIVKAYEWQQDVLYGPYLRPLDWPSGKTSVPVLSGTQPSETSADGWIFHDA
jgi:hypothetical protein